MRASAVALLAVLTIVTPAQMRAWSKVAHCEEHGHWHVRGSVYSGGLGITNVNWLTYKPKGFPRSAADATPREQVFVAMRINRGHVIPDQNGGCNPW